MNCKNQLSVVQAGRESLAWPSGFCDYPDVGNDVRTLLERRRRELLTFIQRMERSGPHVITIETEAFLRDPQGQAPDAWALAGHSEAINLDTLPSGFTGCDVRYRLAPLRACFVFRAQQAPTDEQLALLKQQALAVAPPRRLPRLYAGHSLHTGRDVLRVEVQCLSADEHADEQARARKKFSVIDAEIDAQLSALPADTAQEDRDRKLLASARELMLQVERRGQLAALDYSLESLDVCTRVLSGLAQLDSTQQYLGFSAERYGQMVLVACAVYVGDVLQRSRPDCRLQLAFNETGALREIELIDASDEDSLRILRLLTLCLKCEQSPQTHDLRLQVMAWLHPTAN